MKLSVIIPAAGASTRFGSGDKLSVDLAGRPLLLRTVEIFSRRQEVFQIIVAGPPDSMDAFKEDSAVSAFMAWHLWRGVERIDGDRQQRTRSRDETATHVAVHILLALWSQMKSWIESSRQPSGWMRLFPSSPFRPLGDRSFFEDRCRRGW